MMVNERYSRQILFAGIGQKPTPAGRSRAVIIGCGALGSAQAESLARAGWGICASWIAILFRILESATTDNVHGE